MIKITLDELLKKRKMSLYKLQKETDISYNALRSIRDNKVQGITFDVLEKLCDKLECTPNDLLVLEK